MSYNLSLNNFFSGACSYLSYGCSWTSQTYLNVNTVAKGHFDGFCRFFCSEKSAGTWTKIIVVLTLSCASLYLIKSVFNSYNHKTPPTSPPRPLPAPPPTSLNFSERSIGKLPKLKNPNLVEEIDLSKNKLKKLSVDWVEQLSNLKALNLTENQLEALPGTLGNLTHLLKLNLNANQLRLLPATIGNLSKLQTLLASQNKLEQLPVEIGNLENLQEFLLPMNLLKTLPDSIGNLKKLKTLSLRANRLELLPDSIGGLHNLETLDLAANDLNDGLPDSIGNLSNLAILYLGNNKLEKLPGSIQKLSKLRKLDLWKNKFSQLPEELQYLNNLEELFLTQNNLIELPSWIGSLLSLRKFDLRYNELVALPSTLANLPSNATIGPLHNLQELFLQGNNLTNLPEWIGNLPNLKTLNLNQNRFTEIPLSLARLPRDCTILMEGNTLSAETIEAFEVAVTSIRQSNGTCGPRLCHSMGSPTALSQQAVEEELSLDDAIADWWGSDSSNPPEFLGLDEQNGKTLVLFLNKIKEIPDYSNSQLKQQVVDQVKNFLILGADDFSFREQLLKLASKAVSTCADRGLICYNDVCDAALVHKGKDPLEKLRLVVGLERKKLLSNEVEEYIKTLATVDPLQKHLYAQIELRERLDLHLASTNMTFKELGKIPPAILEEMAMKVLLKTSDEEQVFVFLNDYDAWKVTADQNTQQEQAKAAQPFVDRINASEDEVVLFNNPTFKNNEISADQATKIFNANKIAEEREQALKKVRDEWSLKLIKEWRKGKN